MASLHTRVAQSLTGTCYSSDKEIVDEVAEMVNEIDDVRYGSVVVDIIRRQITAKLEDGRKLRLTVIFE